MLRASPLLLLLAACRTLKDGAGSGDVEPGPSDAGEVDGDDGDGGSDATGDGGSADGGSADGGGEADPDLDDGCWLDPATGADALVCSGVATSANTYYSLNGVADIDADGIEGLWDGWNGCLYADEPVWGKGTVAVLVCQGELRWTSPYVSGGDLDGDGMTELTSYVAPAESGDSYGVAIFDAPLADGWSIGDATAVLWADQVGTTGFLEYAGYFHDSGGDLDGDGAADLLAIDPTFWTEELHDDDTYSEYIYGSRVFLVHGPVTGNMQLTDAAATIDGDLYNETLPYYYRVAAQGDLDGDGLAEVVLNGTGMDGVAAVVVDGEATGASTMADWDAIWLSGDGREGLPGWQMHIGDLDGDGNADLAFGDAYASDAEDNGGVGRISIAAGPIAGAVSLSEAVATVEGPSDGRGFGRMTRVRAASSGARLVVAATSEGYPASYGGGAWVFDGPLTGTLTVDDASFAVVPPEIGGAVYDSTLADLDGDGVQDLVSLVSLPWGEPVTEDAEQSDGYTSGYLVFRDFE